jgi:hypothetical protein
MKKVAIIVFVAAIIVGVVVSNMFTFGRWSSRLFNVSVNFGGVKGSGNMATEQRGVSDFDAIDVGGVFQVDVVLGKEYSVEIEADDNLLPLIETDVRGSTLHIDLDKKVSTQNGLIVRITAPNIERIDVSGASKVTASGFSGDTLTIDCSGASRVKLAGETALLKVDVSGASNVDAEALKAVNATVDASGASRVDVSVSGELTSEASGASRISYSGQPSNVIKNKSGAGSITPK